MQEIINELGQAIGQPLHAWKPAKTPVTDRMEGSYCIVERANSKLHAADLYEAYSQDKADKMWTYLSYGPFKSEDDLVKWLDDSTGSTTQIFYAIIDKASGKALGLASYLRIDPENAVVETGAISFSPQLQRTFIATEAIYLMMKFIFDDCGYRRYEWKCDALNSASCRAAERFGFKFEALFRQPIIYKNRNRDTAWYSIIDKEWPALKRGFQAWLSLDNFDSAGIQKTRLEDTIANKS